ncbi:MAG: aspartate aminotransferase family protein [Nitrososphaerota archaeon]
MRYIEATPSSRARFEEARKHLPGGVSYSIRYFEPYPIYVSAARDRRIWDLDGNEYTDYWMGHGALLMGHGYRPVIEAAMSQLREYAHVGLPHEWEVKLARQISRMVESVEMIRFTNSGTEAAMYACRLARAYTGRKAIAKFEGGWHGGFDCLHIGVQPPYEAPGSLGILEDSLKHTILLPFNDLEGVERRVKGLELAAIIIEPVLGAGGAIPADPDFLKGLREICDSLGALLIFDEVITGFRLSPGGAQKIYGVKPDLTIFGKILGGGIFPSGGFGGRADIMELLDQVKHPRPHERAFQGGTYAANPLTTRAGYTLLRELEEKPEIYQELNTLGEHARNELENVFSRYGLEAHVTGIGSMIGLHFTREKPRSAAMAQREKRLELAKAFFIHALESGIIYLTPESPLLFISAAHTREDLDRLIEVAEYFAKKKATL